MKLIFVTVGFCLTLFVNEVVGQVIVTKNNKEFDTTLLAQECNLDKEELGKIFTKLEVYAEFPGGFRKWVEFANNNFDFTFLSHCLGDTVQYFQDSIVVKFIVTRNGKICNLTVGAGNPILTAPALKLLKLSPNWNPGEISGRQLNSYRTLKLNILIDREKCIETIKHNKIAEPTENCLLR